VKLSIRDAVRGDAALIAWVQMMAARSGRPLGLWDLMFPGSDRPRLDLIAQVALSPHESFAQLSGFLVAEVDGVAVGALSGYAPAIKHLDHFRHALAAVLTEDGWSEAHRKLIGSRIAPCLSCISETPHDRWVVEWVALESDARGKGVASALLAAILERGRASGFDKAQISVLIGNTPAQRCYERAGFRIVDEKRNPDFEAMFGAPGVARMWMDLGSQPVQTR
jgi:ribosomal protein S18 acetylase RimI-like enzyme